MGHFHTRTVMLCTIFLVTMTISVDAILREVSVSEGLKTCSFTYGSVIKQGQVRSITDCQSKCTDMVSCQSYMYNVDERVCALNNDTVVDESSLPSDCGVVYVKVFRGHCEPGWTQHVARCYKYIDQLMTWEQGLKYCHTFGGHLAILHHPSLFPIFEQVTRTAWETAVNTHSWPWVAANDISEEGDLRDAFGYYVPDSVRVDYNWWSSDCGYAGEIAIIMTGCSGGRSIMCEKSAF